MFNVCYFLQQCYFNYAYRNLLTPYAMLSTIKSMKKMSLLIITVMMLGTAFGALLQREVYKVGPCSWTL